MHLPHSREADQYFTEAWTLLKLVIPWLFLQGYQRVSPSVSVFVHWQSRAEVRRVSSPTDLLMSLIDNPRQCRALTLVSCTDCHCNLWERKWNQCWLWLDESHNLPGAWWMSSTSWCLLRRRCSIKAVGSSLAHRVLTSKLQNFTLQLEQCSNFHMLTVEHNWTILLCLHFPRDALWLPSNSDTRTLFLADGWCALTHEAVKQLHVLLSRWFLRKCNKMCLWRD